MQFFLLLKVLLLCFAGHCLCQCTGPADCAPQFYCNTTTGFCQRFQCSANVSCPDSIGGSYCEPNTGFCYSLACFPFGVCDIPGFVCSNTQQCLPSVGICFQASDCPTDFYCLCGTCISTACFSDSNCQQFIPTTECQNGLCSATDCRNASCGSPCLNASFQCNPFNGKCETGNLTTPAPTTITNSPSLAPTEITNSPSLAPTASPSFSPTTTFAPSSQTNSPTTASPTPPVVPPTTQNKEPTVSYYILYAYLIIMALIILAYLLYIITRPRRK